MLDKVAEEAHIVSRCKKFARYSVSHGIAGQMWIALRLPLCPPDASHCPRCCARRRGSCRAIGRR